jgi:hypothetical protein
MKSKSDSLVESLVACSPDRASARRQVAEMALGIATAVQEGGLTVEQACNDLFTLDNYLSLRRNRLGKDLLEIFDWGMQLQDVLALVQRAGALDESLRSIVSIARGVLAVPAAHATRPRRARKPERASSASRAA